MILLSYGTRPEWIKLLPLIHEFKLKGFEHRVLFTGQHKELIDADNYDWRIKIIDGENRLDSIVQSIMNKFNSLIARYKITHVMVQGDTTSAMAVALAAFHRGLKVIHLEAGLRTFDKDNPYPEEINRRLITHLADIHFCPTEQNARNVFHDKFDSKDVYVVGNTVIDNLLYYRHKCEYTDKILVTMHRRENHESMHLWFIALNALARAFSQYEFIFPIHPNPNVQKYRFLLQDINVINPLSYEDLLNLLVKTKMVITDSGGLQEECSYFKKKCLVCRKVTERPEAVGGSSFLVTSPNELKDKFQYHIENYETDSVCPFGDGHAAEKIYEILKKIE